MTNADYPDMPIDGAYRAPGPTPWQLLCKILKPIASLQLTVVLFTLSLGLVFFGTVAQTEEGIWTVVHDYFRSFVVWVPFQLFAKFGMVFFDLPKMTQWNGSFPFPAGYLIGFTMLVNLLSAHLVRFRMSWKRAGIFLIHSGFVLLMVSEFITGEASVEAKMYLQKGESSNFLDDSRNVEIAITWEEDGVSKETIVPGSLLKKVAPIKNDQLPVDIEVIEYHKNSALVELIGGKDDDDDVLIYAINATELKIEPGTAPGRRLVVRPKPEEVGVKASREDAPAVRVILRNKETGTEIGNYFLSLWQYRNFNQRMVIGRPHLFTVDGITYTVELRNKRIYKPYTMLLTDFEHKVYPGTFVPKDFASTVTLNDSERKDGREGIRIWMNNPFRYRGETFYQSGVMPEDSGTVLQVVNNPGWMLPYISCAVITLGMLVHFSIALLTFLQRRLSR